MESFLEGADTLVKLFLALLFDRPVADFKDLFAQEVQDFVVHLETEPHQPQRLGAVEELQDLGLLHLGAARQDAQRDFFTKSRRMLEQLAALHIEVVDLLLHDFFERSREVAVVKLLDRPLLAEERQHLVGNQLADDLADKKRVAVGDISQILLEIFGHLEAGKDALQVRLDFVAGEWAKLDPLNTEFLFRGRQKSFQRRSLLFSCQIQGSTADKQIHLGSRHDGPQHQQRGLVGELQIIDEQDERLLADQPWDDLHEHGKDALAHQDLVPVGRSGIFVCDLRQNVREICPLSRGDA